MNKKAQAAMEFLMTYGWAILVVLVVIGALAYFGVLNPAKLVPDKCVASAGISCQEYSVKSISGGSEFKTKIVNGLGSAITFVTDSTVSYFDSPDTTNCNINPLLDPDISTTTPPYTWEAGQALTITANCDSLAAGNKARGTLHLRYYTRDPQFTHDIVVEVSATVQQG